MCMHWVLGLIVQLACAWNLTIATTPQKLHRVQYVLMSILPVALPPVFHLPLEVVVGQVVPSYILILLQTLVTSQRFLVHEEFGGQWKVVLTAVKSAIQRLCPDLPNSLRVRRKLKTNGEKIRLWYIVHGPEHVLSILEQQWEAVKLQTSWNLWTMFCTPSVCPQLSHSWKHHNRSCPQQF